MNESRVRFAFVACALVAVHVGTAALWAASGGDGVPAQPARLRQALWARVGDLSRLSVARDDAGLPQPRLSDGSIDPRFAITEAKRYLGKMLFHDPIRSNDIRPEFGGIPSTRQTASCGSCHLGAAAAKAGVLFNLAVGGAGLGFREPPSGRFVPRRRTLSGLVDTIPTALELTIDGVVVRSGRFDAVDSVPRLAPTALGFAFNQRLLLGGIAGEPNGPGKANKNPEGLPAGENLVEIAFTAHRMAGSQANALQAIPAYVALFRQAFPEEAAAAEAASDSGMLINDHTTARAIAAFLRTAVTRTTAWDRFLAGDDSAMTPRQVRGALLFTSPASEGGANCIACHSGPMLNKVLGDEDGRQVEANFHNIGIGDHPLQELARAALGDPGRRDVGRAEATGRAEDRFKFKTPTLRQVRDGGQFTHAGSFGSVREVVDYFNRGVPLDTEAAVAGNLSPLFTGPRGPGTPAGLGLTPADVTALVDFLENALYDPAFKRDDPSSSTPAFDPTARDLAFSVRRPDLAALGARDGFMPSGLPPINDDALSRRDLGLELLDVSSMIRVDRSIAPQERTTGSGLPPARVERLTIRNVGIDLVDTDLMVILRGLPPGVSLEDRDGMTVFLPEPSLPYRRMFLPGGALEPGNSLDVFLRFSMPAGARLDFDVVLLSGQGQP